MTMANLLCDVTTASHKKANNFLSCTQYLFFFFSCLGSLKIIKKTSYFFFLKRINNPTETTTRIKEYLYIDLIVFSPHRGIAKRGRNFPLLPPKYL